jgi:hypothetical protein
MMPDARMYASSRSSCTAATVLIRLMLVFGTFFTLLPSGAELPAPPTAQLRGLGSQ